MSHPQQSPINIQKPYQVHLGHRGLVVKYCGASPARVVREPEGAKLQFSPRRFWDQMIEVDGKPFGLHSIHFHAPSEHAIEDRFHDLEWHLVHLNVDEGTSYVVIALLIDLDPRDEAADPGVITRDFLDPLAKFFNETPDKNPSSDDSEVEVLPLGLLPPSPEDQSYYRYEGSLTTPDYDENVSWIVMPPIRLSKKYFDGLSLLEHLAKPARMPQPVHRRMILQNRPVSSAGEASRKIAGATKNPVESPVGERVGRPKTAEKRSRR